MTKKEILANKENLEQIFLSNFENSMKTSERLGLDAETTVSKEAKALYMKALTEGVKTSTLKKLTSQLCKDFGCSEPLEVKFSGVQSGAKNKFHGGEYKHYVLKNNGKPFKTVGELKVCKYAKDTKTMIGSESYMHVFLHEFCHHLDHVKFNIISEHTEGFYFRIIELEKALKGEDAPTKAKPYSSAVWLFLLPLACSTVPANSKPHGELCGFLCPFARVRAKGPWPGRAKKIQKNSPKGLTRTRKNPIFVM